MTRYSFCLPEYTEKLMIGEYTFDLKDDVYAVESVSFS